MAKCLGKCNFEVIKVKRHLPTVNMQVCSARLFFVFIITQLPEFRFVLEGKSKYKQ